MTGMEPGWYRDPAPPNPAFPTTLRYWDGSGWTEQVKAASKREREVWHHELAVAQAEQAAQAWQQAVATGTIAPEQLAQATQRHATPDGQPLSGWWRRVGASIIDAILTTTVGVALGWHWISQIGAAYSGFIRLVAESARTGAAMPDSTALTEQLAHPTLMVGLVLFCVQLAYGVGFLKAFGATPGKMVVGIEVRLRERPGPMPWGTVLARWFTQNGVGLLRFLPVVGSVLVLFGSVFVLLDVLWPLWDGRRQALHDKVARTNVVRRSD